MGRILGIFWASFMMTIVCIFIWIIFFLIMTIVTLDPREAYSIMKMDWQIFRLIISSIILSVIITDLIVGGINK